MNPLTLSTTVNIKMGPFLDLSDGVTEETGVSPTVNISKAGAAFAARNSATAIAHDADGWYTVELDTTDTNTLGRLIAYAQDPATHLPVWHEFEVVPESSVPASHSFVGLLKTDAAQQITVGPFISVDTGLPLTSLTVGDITCGIIKHGIPPTNTAITLTASGGSNDFVHLANGMWRVEITATDVNTQGDWIITFQDNDVFMPVYVHAQVISQDNYAGLIATGAAGNFLPVDLREMSGTSVKYTTDGGFNYQQVDLRLIKGFSTKLDSLSTAIDTTNHNLAADVQQISGDTAAADNLEAACDGTTYNLGGGAITVDVTKISGDSTAADRLEDISNEGTPTFTVDDTSFAPTTTAFESSATEATDDHYNDRNVVFVTGALAGQRKQCTDYTLSGGRGKFTVDALTEAPANGDQFYLM